MCAKIKCVLLLISFDSNCSYTINSWVLFRTFMKWKNLTLTKWEADDSPSHDIFCSHIFFFSVISQQTDVQTCSIRYEFIWQFCCVMRAGEWICNSRPIMAFPSQTGSMCPNERQHHLHRLAGVSSHLITLQHSNPSDLLHMCLRLVLCLDICMGNCF